MIISRVLLPHPLGPSRETNSPSRTSRLMSTRAVISSWREKLSRTLNTLPRFLTSSFIAACVHRSIYSLSVPHR